MRLQGKVDSITAGAPGTIDVRMYGKEENVGGERVMLILNVSEEDAPKYHFGKEVTVVVNARPLDRET